MENILYFAPVEADGTLAKDALEAAGAAKKLAADLGGTLTVGLYGASIETAAASLAGIGATAFFAVSGPAFAQARYATDAAAVTELAKAASASIVIGPASSRVARVAAGVAARLGGRVDTSVTALSVCSGAVQVTRWFYRQRLFAEYSRPERPWVITLASGCFAPFAGQSAPVTLTPVDATASPRTEVTRIISPAAEERTIRPEAELLFVAGAGWTKKQADGAAHVDQAEEIILGFLNKSQASLGTSKSLIDLSGEGQQVMRFLTHMHQVGQTGATPRHPKGLATCCHGEEPHVVGWRFIGERRAVNLDAACGWAQGKADVLYVADAFKVMREVIKLMA